MDVVTFLEQLANQAHHRAEINELINTQSDVIKEAIFTNNSELLKRQIADTEYFADAIRIFQN